MQDGFEISAMEMFYLERKKAEEFFELYKGVLPDFSSLIDNVIQGPIIVMEVR